MKRAIKTIVIIAAATIIPHAYADDDAAERASKQIVNAAARGESELKQIIARGYDINMTDEDGETPLMRAAERGNLKAVDVLLKAGAKVNMQDKDGKTALMEAADDGHNAVVQRLIEAGADINAKDEDGETALYKAQDERHTDTANILRRAGAQ